jgi:hypothetical protein
MPYDYTNAPPREVELMPHGTVATVIMYIQPGDVGEDGMCKRSSKGDCEMLSCEFVVVDGPYAKRKLWENMILAGSTDGHAQAANISRGRLKQMLDSALGLKPDDTSPQARTARTVSLGQLQGLTFIAKIGIEKGTPKDDGSGESWPDKNILAAIITPDRNGYHPVTQPPPSNGGGPTTPGSAAPSGAAPPTTTPPITRPGWAS